MTRKSIREKVWERDEEFIKAEAIRQAKAGATHIDINAGGDPAKEVQDMEWLTHVVSKVSELPLSFDSTNPEALETGLKICNREKTIINSITAEKERLDGILPLVAKYKTSVVALTMDDAGMPEDTDGRMRITRALADILKKEGVALDRVYFDHLIRPASTNPGQARSVLEAIAATKSEFPDAHIALGLSNISFGLPERNNLNRAFLAMLIAAGCDGAVMDPCEPGMMNTLYSSFAILGLDEYCMGYITAQREGKLAM
jgi:5-methyltetrahydrofolate--homocysteine methyltransferase